ncbi:MAG: hypothetical protein J6D19_06235 [Clostridia bacterium]|nr:hypothetical protein [Clostridia bacterium]
MQHKNMPMSDIIFLAAGEGIASLIIVGVYLLLGEFDFRVATGAVLGSAVTVLNFAILSFSVNRAVDRVMEMRGNKEMTEEEASAFALQHSAEIQKSVKSSYFLRQIIMLGVLVAAVLLKIASILPAVIPLLLFRPILMAREAFRKKKT